MSQPYDLKARLRLNVIGFLVAVIVGVAMYWLFPSAPVWLNLLPSAIIWTVIVPLKSFQASRERQKGMD